MKFKKISAVATGKKIVSSLAENATRMSNCIPAKVFRDDDSSVRFIEMKSEQQSSTAVITVNGFLSEKNLDTKGWSALVSKKYSDAQWMHLDWDAQIPFEIVKSTITHALLMPGAVPLKLALGGFDIVRHWRKALHNSEEAGRQLAEYMIKNPTRYCLAGHSLGARVIYYALKNLSEHGTVVSVDTVMLFGGAVGSKVEKWMPVAPSVCRNIINCYSKNDKVLKYLYSIGTVDDGKPVGRNPIAVNENVSNVDLSQEVSSHLDYKKYFLSSEVLC